MFARASISSAGVVGRPVTMETSDKVEIARSARVRRLESMISVETGFG